MYYLSLICIKYSQKNRGELIIKLEIDIPQTHKIGTVEIYENDKPTILANQFMRKYKVNTEFYDSVYYYY